MSRGTQPNPTSSRSAAPVNWLVRAFGCASFWLSLGLLALLVVATHGLTTVLFAGHPQQDRYSGLVAGVLMAGYLIAALGKLVPPTRQVLDPEGQNPQYEPLFACLTRVCAAAGVAQPKVVIRPHPTPNLRSCGLWPGWACLYVDQSLLAALPGDALEAPLAHEVAHLARFDALFGCLAGPLLWSIQGVFYAICYVLAMLPRPRANSGCLPALFESCLYAGAFGGCLPVLILLFAAFVAAALFMAIAVQVAVYFLAVLAAVSVTTWYLRYCERQADVEAAAILNNPQRVLDALDAMARFYPEEEAALNAFAVASLGNVQQYSLVDIVGSLQAGNRPQKGMSGLALLFATHPSVVERMAAIVARYQRRAAP